MRLLVKFSNSSVPKSFRGWLTWLMLQCLHLLWFLCWILTWINIIATIHAWVKNTLTICILLWSYVLRPISLHTFFVGLVIFPAWFCSPIWLIVSWFGNAWNLLSLTLKKDEFWLEKKDTLQGNSKSQCLKITD